VVVESAEEPVEVGSVERTLEWSGDLPVVLPEREQSFAERFMGVEVVGGQRFALDDREVELDLIEPGGVDRQVDQPHPTSPPESLPEERTPPRSLPLATTICGLAHAFCRTAAARRKQRTLSRSVRPKHC
jgi:hypothetical protein